MADSGAEGVCPAARADLDGGGGREEREADGRELPLGVVHVDTEVSDNVCEDGELDQVHLNTGCEVDAQGSVDACEQREGNLLELPGAIPRHCEARCDPRALGRQGV